jgi:hypothetical protein
MSTKIKILALASILASLGLVPTKALAYITTRMVGDGVVLSISCRKDRIGTVINWSTTFPENNKALLYQFTLTTSDGESRDFGEDFRPGSSTDRAAMWRPSGKYQTSATWRGSFVQETGGNVIINPPITTSCGN